MATIPGQQFADWTQVPSLTGGDGIGGTLLAMGVDASGLGKFLDGMEISKKDKGGWEYKPVAPPENSVQPIVPTMGVAPQPFQQLQPPKVPQLGQWHPEIDDSWSK